jgi:hypothetical protein
MAKEKKTRAQLILLIEKQLWKRREYQAVGHIDIHPYVDGKSDITWGVDLVNGKDGSKCEWTPALNEIIPQLQMEFDLTTDAEAMPASMHIPDTRHVSH